MKTKSANTETTNILGKPYEETIKPISPEEMTRININWIDIEKYIELINHSIKMTVLKNIAASWFTACIDEIIPAEMCDKIANKYVDAGWDHVYYSTFSEWPSREIYTKFIISDMEVNIPHIESYTHIFRLEDMKERIRSAAIKYRKKGDTEFKYMEGRSHAECINAFGFIDLYANMRDTDNEVQGFMTTKNRFVDRVEGLDIAKKAGQVNEYYSKDYLISEAIDWAK